MSDKAPRAKRGTPEYIEKMRRAGEKGGRANVETHGLEHMQNIGRMGGESLLAKRGREHFAAIGKMSKKGDTDG